MKIHIAINGACGRMGQRMIALAKEDPQLQLVAAIDAATNPLQGSDAGEAAGIGKIGMTICYDLIFPEYVRRLVEMGADFIINSTNWINDPYQRDMWGWSGERVRGLASTRALENVTVMAMSCRVGHEVAAPGVEFDSFGHSTIASPSGKILASMTEGEGLAYAKIDIPAADIQRWRGIATYRTDRRPNLYR